MTRDPERVEHVEGQMELPLTAPTTLPRVTDEVTATYLVRTAVYDDATMIYLYHRSGRLLTSYVERNH